MNESPSEKHFPEGTQTGMW